MRGRVLAALATLTLVVGCTGMDQKDVEGKVRVVGSTNVVPLLRMATKPFLEQHPNVKIEWRASNSNYAFGDPAVNADLVAAIRPPKENEKETFTDAVELGRDALCVIVHKANPIKSLTKEQLKRVMSAEADNKTVKWSDVGGEDIEIRAIVPSDPRQTMTLLLEYFGIQRFELAYFSNEGGNEQAIEGVQGDREAIATIGCSAAKEAAKKGQVKMLPIGGAEPSVANIAAGKPDIVFPLYVSANKSFMKEKPQLEALFEYLKDPKNLAAGLKELDLAPPAAG